MASASVQPRRLSNGSAGGLEQVNRDLRVGTPSDRNVAEQAVIHGFEGRPDRIRRCSSTILEGRKTSDATGSRSVSGWLTVILCGAFITTSDANIHEVDVVRLTNQVLIEVYDIPEEIDLESSR